MRQVALLAIAFIGGVCAADSPKLSVKVDAIDPPKEVANPIRESLSNRACLISNADGAIAALWMRKEIPIGKGEPTYQAIAPGTLIGVLRLDRAWTDFRGNEAPAGAYTLRLALQPKSKDHEGTSPSRDFCILVPVAQDVKLDVLTLKEMVSKSGKATGGTHPLVMLLVPCAKPQAAPMLITEGKRVAVGIRATEKLGFGFTFVGSWTD